HVRTLCASVALFSLCWSLVIVVGVVGSGFARFRHPSIRALLGRAISLAALEGSSKGGGAIYAAALGRRPRKHARSPTHRTCERPEARTVCSSRSALKGGGEGGPWGAWWVEDGAVAE